MEEEETYTSGAAFEKDIDDIYSADAQSSDTDEDEE